MRNEIKVLILEDDPQDAELIEHELKRSEYYFTTEIVKTKDEFVSALDRFMPDLILADYSLPSFDGFTAFHLKQVKHPEIPFIIVSGTIGEELAVDLIKNGVIDYTLKDKLYTLIPKIVRAINEVEEKKAKIVIDEKLRQQHKKLFEIAILQSHQVRAPIANVLGLISLINFENPADPANLDIIKHLQKTTIEFDHVIHEIVSKTSEIEMLQ